MRLIKSMPPRIGPSGNPQAMALFWCAECKQEVIRHRTSLHSASCGCARHKQKPKKRYEEKAICLKCDKEFNSSDIKTNRICPSCKNINETIEYTHSRLHRHKTCLNASHDHTPFT